MSRRYVAVLLATAVFIMLAAPSQAATVARFAADTAGDLEIAPSEDPVVSEISGSGSPVFIVQRMRATKTITSVTLGDFGLAAGCASTHAQLTLRHHANGNPFVWSAPVDVGVVADAKVAVPSEPARLTWTFARPVTLHKDQTYSFDLATDNCNKIKQRTWHKEGVVESLIDLPSRVELRCQTAPLPRVWHTQGAVDWPAGCAPDPVNNDYFRNLPTGWIAWNRHVAQPYEPYSGSPSTPCHTSAGQHWGVAIAWLRPGGSSGRVCVFDQFMPPGRTGAETWYYAWPWPAERNGQPRDLYVRLKTIDYDSLLYRHLPYYNFDRQENFYPQKVEAFTNHGWHNGFGSWHGSTLLDSGDNAIAAANHPTLRALTAGVLGANYFFSPTEQPASTPDDYIDADGDEESTYLAASEQEAAYGHGEVVYARAAEGSDDTLWLQYWLFYYYNSYHRVGVGVHEGDWEMVQVGLDRTTMQPTKMTFATHNEGIACRWDEVEKVGDGRYPLAYVAARSHATYPWAGSSEVIPHATQDSHMGDGKVKFFGMVGITTGDPHWTTWRGRWGASRDGQTTSPPNPSQQHQRWWEPSEFHDGAGSCAGPTESAN